MSEVKYRLYSHKSSQSPQERENRLRSDLVRKQLKRFSESSETSEGRVANIKIQY